MLMITRRILPRHNAVSPDGRPLRAVPRIAPMVSICQFIANWLRGLSSRKERCANMTKSSRSKVAYVFGVILPGAVSIAPHPRI
jgi:hypothetical protein